jgi:hypothetical protein
MKISVDQKQREVYLRDGALILEGILPPDFQEEVLKEADRVDAGGGRNLWRKSPALQQLDGCRPLVDVAAQLLGVKLVRLGFDHYIPSFAGAYEDWIQGRASLEEVSSIQGNSCGVLISLTGNGDGLFVEPSHSVDLTPWIENDGPYYLILYTSAKSRYVLNRRDPGSSVMARLGYNTGDRLKEGSNPIVHK